MTKFHITEDGPKSCTAQPGNCPITKDTGAPHYKNKEEAQYNYEKQMKEKLCNEKRKNENVKNIQTLENSNSCGIISRSLEL